jgi:hypothetical protein
MTHTAWRLSVRDRRRRRIVPSVSDPAIDPAREIAGGTTVTAAWALIHAVEHLQEHVAHAELTRQVWDRAATGRPE